MSNFLKNVGIILASVLSFLGQIASSLIHNPIFIVLVAIIIFLLLIGLLIKLVNERTGFIDRIYYERRRRNNN